MEVGFEYGLSFYDIANADSTLAGHVFAGATLPFGNRCNTTCLNRVWLTNLGMAKAVADTRGENQAGFAYDTTVVTGFSHMHDSGTGGVSFHIHEGILPLLTRCKGTIHG